MQDTFRLEYKPLSAEQSAAVLRIKGEAHNYLNTIEWAMMPSWERALAQTKLEECVMWAVKGITG